MKNKKIIYTCPGYPFPADFGGSQCWLEHIKELAQSKYNSNIEYIFSYKEQKVQNLNLDINYKIILPTRLSEKPSLRNKLKRLLALFSKWTFLMSLKIDKKTNIINKTIVDLIILDGITMLPILSYFQKNKLIYIAHNIEFDYEISQAKLEHNKLLKVYRYIDAYKTKFLEDALLKKADKIVCVSTSDYKIITKKYKDKTILLPHKIGLNNEKWTGSQDKTLFFCGATWFYPNNEAIEWIVNELSPILSKDIKIKIAGKGTDEVPESWKRDNIEFLGFVSKEELYNLYKTSGAFICPIIYGSGVKIKVTEALSFGMPIIATKESLEGLDYIDIQPLIDRKDLQKTKKNIEELLNNSEKLQDYSNNLIFQVETFQKDNNSLEKILKECRNE